MKFTLDGQEYRIGFQHDKPRDWYSHFRCGSAVSFVFDDGQVTLFCGRCRVSLADVGPTMARKLTACVGEIKTDAEAVRAVLAAANAREIARELARNVNCAIYAKREGAWVAIYTGSSRLNTDEGDRYDREAGRLAALRNALPKRALPAGVQFDERFAREKARHQFCAAAMAAYLDRPRKAKTSLRLARTKSGGAQ